MGKVPRISEAEWEVMNALWDHAPRSAQEVAEALGNGRWSLQTVKTLLTRLVRKGALSYQVDGQRYLYRPKVARDACVRAEGRSFLKRVSAEALSPTLAHFVRASRLSAEEIAELRRILDEKEAGR